MTETLIPRQRNADGPGRASLRALVVGAGEAGRALARDLQRSPELGLAPMGFLDDGVTGTLDGLRVLGGLDDLAPLTLIHNVDVVVLAIPSLPHEAFRRLAAAAASVGVAVRYLPSFTTALQREVVGSDMRALDVHALIGRQEMHVVSAAARQVIAGRRVLVTGAGGSIGSELCRQVSGFRPSRLVMLDHDESNLHRLQLELSGEALLHSPDLVVADIRDRARIEHVFDQVAPEVVFHAAAHKHLPLLEQHPCEGVKSNVLGTEHLVRAAVAHGVERFILISTDKAADPLSVLGATKRLAELIVQRHAGLGTAMASVRFGNVLGSRGSLLTVLAEQMRNGRPVTITHPDVTRFFMTIEEAVGLVLEAALMADGGETFVLDMGDPVRIVDLVQNYAHQLHLADVDITFTGLRPGEKLTEALFSEHEECSPTGHPSIWKTTHRPLDHGFAWRLTTLYDAAANNDADLVRARFRELLPEYAGSDVSDKSTVPTGPVVPTIAALYPDDF